MIFRLIQIFRTQSFFVQTFGLKNQSGQFKHKFGTWTTSNDFNFSLKHLSLSYHISLYLVYYYFWLISYDVIYSWLQWFLFISWVVVVVVVVAPVEVRIVAVLVVVAVVFVFLLAWILVKIIIWALHLDSIQKHYHKCKQGTLFFWFSNNIA